MTAEGGWPPTGNSYRAWVPTNTGQLSFSQIGLQCSPRPFILEYIDGEDACIIECIENRSLKLDDSLFNLSSRFGMILGNKDDIYFVLNSSCKHRQTTSDYLIGDIACIYGTVAKRKLLNPFQMIKRRRVFKPMEVSNDLAAADIVFTVKFCLSRRGRCKIYNFQLGDDVTYAAQRRENVEEYLCSQAYMFLRDMLHRHKHHSPGSDTFIDLQPATHKWRKQVAYSLGKQMIKKPIPRQPETLQDAIGVMAYLQSFQKTHSVKVYDDEILSATKASLEAEHKNITKRLSDVRWMWSLINALLIFVYVRYLDWSVADFNALHYSAPIAIFTVMLIAMSQTSFLDVRQTRLYIELMKVLTRQKLLSCIFLIGLILIAIVGAYRSYDPVFSFLLKS